MAFLHHHLPFHLHLTTLTPPTRTSPRLLRTLACASPDGLHGSRSPSQSVLDSFWQWATDKGAVSSSLKPGFFVPEGLGLLAQRNISGNEVVLEVPKSLWITSELVAASDLGRLCTGFKPWVSISLFLLCERSKGDASPWRPYIDILPQSTDSTIFWSEEELAEIQGTQLLSTTLGVKEYVQSEFLKVENEVILPNKNIFPSTITFDDFLWAFGMLRSRAFSRLRGENLVLIPLADLINHNYRIKSEDDSWEIKAKGIFSRELIFSLRTPVPVNMGEQVYIQYDLKKSDAELAMDYGFIESTSDRQIYTMTLEIAESDPFYGDKLDIAESNGFGESAYFDIVLGCPLPPSMLPYLRLVALEGTDAFLLESIFRDSIWRHLELPVSRSNEEMICKVVRDACRSALSLYQTTIEEDEELLERGQLDPRLKIAVAIRAGEKKVLQQIDSIFNEREQELNGLEYYQERRLKDLGLIGEEGEIIFWESK
ncbi:fructose-bisphosphate aldolase-lysine N-methyltransferase, chloroplastic isoform X1 [Dioscorea cayenensis subsp. rotundata]|uniref:Fructose-bisphosphate aldolase-lysine N-methyltransferase, chloroplastic isoform X1 n=1 Tax=Dioscorea cayennensis subsp. rotundata TaxID=55577 RepID=A0AB40B960_DIOCR|nr:fructose-bisphosphate aldolase-lysine N-methyltransferase, chloroplastic isoform X1 [Dioscorea cayenensis subsp. rotundata]